MRLNESAVCLDCDLPRIRDVLERGLTCFEARRRVHLESFRSYLAKRIVKPDQCRVYVCYLARRCVKTSNKQTYDVKDFCWTGKQTCPLLFHTRHFRVRQPVLPDYRTINKEWSGTYTMTKVGQKKIFILFTFLYFSANAELILSHLLCSDNKIAYSNFLAWSECKQEQFDFPVNHSLVTRNRLGLS